MNLSKIIYIIAVAGFLTSCTSSKIAVSNIPQKDIITLPEPQLNNPPQGLSATIEPKISEFKYEIIKEIAKVEDIKKIEFDNKINLLIDQAKSYLGTRYRFGGTTRRGIDCSAFVQNSFSVINYELPRVAAAQSSMGNTISLEEVRKGDLLFFSQTGRRVSHVAIVESINELGEIFFIHAATSKGVSICSLNDSYWSKRYKKAVRLVQE